MSLEVDTSCAASEWDFRFTPTAAVTWRKTLPRQLTRSASFGQPPSPAAPPPPPPRPAPPPAEAAAEAPGPPPGFDWLPSLALRADAAGPGRGESSALRRRTLARCVSAGDAWDQQRRRERGRSPCRPTAIELLPWNAGGGARTPAGVARWKALGPGSHRQVASPRDHRSLWRACWAPRHNEFPAVGSRATCLASEISATRREIVVEP